MSPAGGAGCLIEPLSEMATLGTGGLFLMLALAIPAFRETSDDDWLKKSDLAVTFLDRYGNEVGSRGIKHNDSVPLDEMPDHLIKATLATEDRRFYEHFGIDLHGTFRALVTNAQAGGVVQGGSTITQQLAKNLFLSNERTIERKINEAFLALWLEAHLTKNEILKLYLDRAYLGGGAFGVDAAAQYYFGKSVRDVTLPEAAMLAGLFKAPTKFSPLVNLPAARARANVVLDNLVDTGFMTEGQVYGARRNPATPIDRTRRRRAELLSRLGLRRDAQARRYVPEIGARALLRGAHRARPAICSTSPSTRSKPTLRQYGRDYGASQSAVVIADLDGGVRAMVGGRDYGASQFNRAIDALRQPGSSFKPYVYATALANGFKPTSVVVDSPVCIGNWCPHNYSGGYSGVDDADPGDHPFDQRHSGQALDRARRRQSQTRPRQDRADRAQFRHPHAAARHAVAADRRRRGQRRSSTRSPTPPSPISARPWRRMPRSKCAPAPANWCGASTATAKPQQVITPQVALDMINMMNSVVQERHRPARAARRHPGRRQDRHHQRLSRRLVRRLHRQFRRRGVDGQRRLFADQAHDRRHAAGA